MPVYDDKGVLQVNDLQSAPADATYVVRTANQHLTNEFILGNMASGLLQVTSVSGVLSSIQPLSNYLALMVQNGAFSLGHYGFFSRHVLDASAASIDILGLPNVFGVIDFLLELRTDRAGTNVDAVTVRFNNDTTAANYFSYSHIVSGTTPTLTVTQRLGTVAGGEIMHAATAATAPTGYRTALHLCIYDYIGATRVRRYTVSGYGQLTDTTGGLYTLLGGGLWKNTTDAILRVTITPINGLNFVAGSRYTILGRGSG